MGSLSNQGNSSSSFKSTSSDIDNPQRSTNSDPRNQNPVSPVGNPIIAEQEVIQDYSPVLSNIVSSVKWCPTSQQELAKAESELLAYLSRPYRSYFVDIGSGWGNQSNQIRTIEMLTNEEMEGEKGKNKETSKKAPLVLVHGFAAGIATWILNLDALAEITGRKVYAFDLIGFGRSTRAPFDLSDGPLVEEQFVDSIERWREMQGIDIFILLGHSFGGYLSSCYSLRYPERVSHLILADPWGIQDRDHAERKTYQLPLWARFATSIFQHFNPLAVLRISGPYGPKLVHRFRGDLREKFRPKLQDDSDKFLNYIYHCNAQYATGESAFKSLVERFGWPKYPLIHRLLDLDPTVDMTFIYGSRSWIDKTTGEILRDYMIPGRVTVNIISGSGHHVYADKFSEFNELVKDTCLRVKT